MSLEKVLSAVFVPSDALQTFAFYLCFKTESEGAFVSLTTPEYMDAVVGSFRERRTARNDNGISVVDLQDVIRLKNGGSIYIKDDVYVYRASCGWFVGLDSPAYSNGELKFLIESVVRITYPVYRILTERVESNGADYDPLTGCFTRQRFYSDLRGVLKAMLVRDIPLWLFYMDLNNFKSVNDVLGRSMGDEILKFISMEIRSVFLGYGNLYRIGGDEFIGVSFGLGHSEAEKIARRIENVTYHAPFGVPVSVAVGIEKFEKVSIHSGSADIDTLIDTYVDRVERKMMASKIVIKSD